MTRDELRQIAASVAPRRGWDFSRMRDDRDPMPWDYCEVVQRYLRPTDHVLDVGTGGGEKFLELAVNFGSGIGVDPDPAMIETARENTPPALVEKVTFIAGAAASLPVPNASCNVVLNRHAVVDVAEIARVLRPGGYFITQQVGAQNTFNICSLFGCGPGGRYREPVQEIPDLAAAFQERGCAILSYGTYNMPYYFVDAESLLFWMQAIPMLEDFDIETHWQQVDYLITEYATPRGIESNEHRELLIVRIPKGF